MLNAENARHVIDSAGADLMEYRTQAPIRALATLLDALEEDSLLRLATVNPDELRYRQGALAQIQALQRCIHPTQPRNQTRL